SKDALRHFQRRGWATNRPAGSPRRNRAPARCRAGSPALRRDRDAAGRACRLVRGYRQGPRPSQVDADAARRGPRAGAAHGEVTIVSAPVPRVSVIMSVLNGEAYLREAVDSILAQTFRDFEFIIIDNASSDGTPAILDSYSDDRIVRMRNSEVLSLTQ